jgi:hypothetical protein
MKTLSIFSYASRRARRVMINNIKKSKNTSIGIVVCHYLDFVLVTIVEGAFYLAH